MIHLPSKIKKFFSRFAVEIIIVLFFVVIHLPGLGREIFNTDVFKWKARTYDFGQGIVTLNFEKTIQKYHPGVTLMWIGTAGVKAYNLYYDLVLGHAPIDNDPATVFELHFIQKLFLVVFISVVLGFIVHVLRKEFGKRVSLAFGLLISVEAFYYALTRVFHLEGLMSTLMIASFVWFYHYLQEEKRIRLFWSVLFASLAFLTKTSAIYLIPFMGLLSFLHLFLESGSFEDSLKSSLKPFCIWVLLSILGFFIFWPAMWTYPLKALSTVYRGIFTIGMERGHEQIYFGQLTEDPGIFYYLVVFVLRSTPVLLAGLVGTLFSLNVADKKEKKFILYSLLFALFYAIQITIPSKKLDRYILPSLMSLGLIASFSYAFFVKEIGKNFGSFIFGLIIGFNLFILWHLDLDYFSYYNPLAGGLERGIHVLEPKWIIGHHEVIKFLELAPFEGGEATVAFPEKYFTQIRPFVEELEIRPVIKNLTGHAKDAHYFFYPVWFDDSDEEDRFVLEYVGELDLRGVPVWNVYRKIPTN